MPVSIRTLPTSTGNSYLSTSGYSSSSSRYSSQPSAYTSNRFSYRPSGSSFTSSSTSSTSSYYRSSAGDDTTGGTSIGNHRSGVSRYTKSSLLDRESSSKPPTGSSSATLSRHRSSADSRAAARDLSVDNSYLKSYSRGYQPSSSASASSSSSAATSTKLSDSSYQNTKRQSYSSLARSVATSGADIYEQYSPSNYKPKVELSRSRSLSETSGDKLLDTTTNNHHTNNHHHRILHSNSVGLGSRASSRDRDTSIDRTASITSKVNHKSSSSFASGACDSCHHNHHHHHHHQNHHHNNNNNNTNHNRHNNNNLSCGCVVAVANTTKTNQKPATNHKSVVTTPTLASATNRSNKNVQPSLVVGTACVTVTTAASSPVIANSISASCIKINDSVSSEPSIIGSSGQQQCGNNRRLTSKNTHDVTNSMIGSPKKGKNNNNTTQQTATTLLSASDFYKLTGVNPLSVNTNFLESECKLARSQVSSSGGRDESPSRLNYAVAYTSRNKNLNNNDDTYNDKPLIPQSTVNRNRALITEDNNNNQSGRTMNCIQKSPEQLDDIKYIDSDDSERKHSPPNASSKMKSAKEYLIGLSQHNGSGGTTNGTTTLPVSKKSTIDVTSTKYNTITAADSMRSYHHLHNAHVSTTTTTNSRNYRNGSIPSSNSSHSSSNNTEPKSNGFKDEFSAELSSSSPPPSNSICSKSGATATNSTTITLPVKCVDKLLDKSKFTSDLNGGSVRNASLRSSPLPTKSVSPSRSWDREGRSTLAVADGATVPTTSSYHHRSSLASSSSNYSDKSSSDDSDGLCGLRNIGNTCFMNSVIQCLSHTRELTNYLKTTTDNRSTTKDQRILYEFSKLIRDMWTPKTRTVTPSELKSAFSSKHRMYSGCAQQDAQEFLRFFLDSLHNATNTGVKGEKLEIDDTMSDNKVADLTWEWYTKVENSVIQNLFVGQFKSSLKCTVCGNTSVTFDPFWDLSVPLQSSSKCKLESCLDFFIKEEVLDGDEMPTCSKCKTRRKSTKSFTIQRFPKYLVIHLKRFSETRWSKLSNIVEFPTGENGLDMAPYAANSSSAKYTLYGISNHMGSTAGGHYVALCKHPVTKKWHEFNDNMVNDASENGLVSSSAYLLFYERATNIKNKFHSAHHHNQQQYIHHHNQQSINRITHNGRLPPGLLNSIHNKSTVTIHLTCSSTSNVEDYSASNNSHYFNTTTTTTTTTTHTDYAEWSMMQSSPNNYYHFYGCGNMFTHHYRQLSLASADFLGHTVLGIVLCTFFYYFILF